MNRIALAFMAQAMGVMYSESFVQHRGHAYPRNDLFTELPS